MSHDEPTLPEQRQAEVLARWLEGHPPPGEIPDDLDPDVVEAVLALRPELAPAPSLSAEDILAGVTVGPLVSPTAAPEQTPPVRAEVAPLATPPPANRPDRRWVPWAIAGLGSLAAAASVLIVASITLSYAPSPEGSVAALEPEPQSDARQIPQANKPEPFRVEPGSVSTQAEGDAVADLGVEEAEDEASSKERSTTIRFDDNRDDDRVAGAGSTPARPSAATRGRLAGEEATGTAPDDAFEDAVADLADEDPAPPDEAVSDLGGLERQEELARVPATVESEDVQIDSTRMTRSSSSGAVASAPAAKAEQSAADRAEPEPDLEQQARPTAPPAGETQAVLVLLDAGKAEEARDQARQLLDGGGLSDLRRADLYWALGKAYRALGQESRARSAFKEAVRLRG